MPPGFSTAEIHLNVSLAIAGVRCVNTETEKRKSTEFRKTSPMECSGYGDSPSAEDLVAVG